MATLNTVERFGLKAGSAGPGYQADLVVLEDLEGFRAVKVMKRGRWVAEDGALLKEDLPAPPPLRSNRCCGLGQDPRHRGRRPEGGSMRVIGLVPDQIITEDLAVEAKIEGGLAVVGSRTGHPQDVRLRAAPWNGQRGHRLYQGLRP